MAAATLSAAAWIALGSLAVTAAGTAYGIASAPSAPVAPKPPSPPPPPPGVPAPPPPVPTAAKAETGVARQRRDRQRGFGLNDTLLTTPLGGGTTARPPSRGLLGGG